MTEGKVCKSCGEFKSFDNYYKHNTYKDGYWSKCKVCLKQRHLDTYERKTEKKFDENGRVCSKCNEYKTWDNYYKDIHRSTGYKHVCKDCQIPLDAIVRKRYRENNLEQCREREKTFRQSEAGQETIYRKNMKRRSQKANVRFTKHQRKEILERDNYICQCCGIIVHDERINTPDKAHIDHILPLNADGSSELDNLQTLCRTCNTSKGAKAISNENLLELILQNH
jgi:5-methylcytosine-specific restriction endonuclease McrA